jgi:hypothetical protein
MLGAVEAVKELHKETGKINNDRAKSPNMH